MVIYFEFTSKDRYWWCRFLKKGFWHVDMYIEKTGYFIRVEPTLANINIEMVFDLPKNSTILKFEKELDLKNKMFNLGNAIPTCVSVAKMLAGVRATSLTPYQLYRYLLKNGAIEYGK